MIHLLSQIPDSGQRCYFIPLCSMLIRYSSAGTQHTLLTDLRIPIQFQGFGFLTASWILFLFCCFVTIGSDTCSPNARRGRQTSTPQAGLRVLPCSQGQGYSNSVSIWATLGSNTKELSERGLQGDDQRGYKICVIRTEEWYFSLEMLAWANGPSLNGSVSFPRVLLYPGNNHALAGVEAEADGFMNIALWLIQHMKWWLQNLGCTCCNPTSLSTSMTS